MIFLPLRDGVYVPPFESWQTDLALSVTVWLLRLGPKRQYKVCLVLLEHLLLELNSHAVRKPKVPQVVRPHGENMYRYSRQQPSWDQSQLPGKPTKRVNEENSSWFQPQLLSHLQPLSLPSWGLRRHGAVSTVLFLNSWPTESMSTIKWLFYMTKFGCFVFCFFFTKQQ